MSAVAEQKQLIKGGAFLIEERQPEDIFTPEDFTEEHRMIAETTRQFIDNEVSPRIGELEKHDWKLARQGPIVMLKFVDSRRDFVIDELPRRLGNHAMLFSEVFGREDFIGRTLLN